MASVIFLRGVNVGGHRTFRPSVLASEMANLDVVNVGAAGTFVVWKSATESELRREILRRLPFDTEVMICSAREVLKLAAGEPFAGEPSGPDIVRFVSVLPKRARVPVALPLNLPAGEDWLVRLVAVRGRFAFGIYRRNTNRPLSSWAKLRSISAAWLRLATGTRFHAFLKFWELNHKKHKTRRRIKSHRRRLKGRALNRTRRQS